MEMSRSHQPFDQPFETLVQVALRIQQMLANEIRA